MVSSDILAEIGRLRVQVELEREEAKWLRKKNEALDKANNTVVRGLTAAEEKWKKSEERMRCLVGEFDRLKKEMKQQGVEIESRKDQIEKQQRTIKVQSNQIATPNDSKKKHWRTPILAVPPTSQHADVYSLSPPAFNLPQRTTPLGNPPPPPPPQTSSDVHTRVQPSSAYPHQAPSFPTRHRQQITSPYRTPTSQPTLLPERQQQYTPTFRYESPLPTRPLVVGGPFGNSRPSTNQSILVEHRREQGGRVSGGESSMAREFAPLFLSSEIWAMRFCSAPQNGAHAALPAFLKERLVLLTNAEEAPALLAAGSSRAVTIAKLINYDLAHKCLCPAVTNGFRPSIDKKLDAIRAKNKGASTPISVRQGILHEAAKAVNDEVLADPGFLRWVERQAHERATASWPVLSPFLNANADHAAAFQDLKDIWRDGTRVGCLMVQKPSVFSVDFPPTGGRSMFNPACHCTKQAEYRGVDPRVLAEQGMRVRLAVTPVVTETDFSGKLGTSLEPRCLHFANCLLSLPG